MSGAEPRESTGPAAEPAGRGLITGPSRVDAAQLRPQVMLHIHLSQEALLAFSDGKPGIIGGAARLEGIGPITLGQVRRFLADTACQVRVQPVIDPEDTPAVDSYEIPRRIREAMFLRMPASCFPYAAGTQRMDLDHTKPYLPLARGGPPGQTGIHGLGPLGRTEHRIKTHSRWRVRQPNPACGFGDHHTTPTTWSPTPEPNTSAMDPSPDTSGRQRRNVALTSSRPP
jgi:hypothetical protein